MGFRQARARLSHDQRGQPDGRAERRDDRIGSADIKAALNLRKADASLAGREGTSRHRLRHCRAGRLRPGPPRLSAIWCSASDWTAGLPAIKVPSVRPTAAEVLLTRRTPSSRTREPGCAGCVLHEGDCGRARRWRGGSMRMGLAVQLGGATIRRIRAVGAHIDHPSSARRRRLSAVDQGAQRLAIVPTGVQSVCGVKAYFALKASAIGCAAHGAGATGDPWRRVGRANQCSPARSSRCSVRCRGARVPVMPLESCLPLVPVPPVKVCAITPR